MMFDLIEIENSKLKKRVKNMTKALAIQRSRNYRLKAKYMRTKTPTMTTIQK